MANREEPYSPEIHCLFVETSLETRLALLVHNDENISDFKEKLCKEHKQVFPEIGEINISALKVKRRRQFYHFSDSMNVCKAFEGISKNWFMYVDAVRVEKSGMLTIMTADQNRSNLEKKKEIAVDSVVVDGLENKAVEKKTRKRKLESSDGKKSRKKLLTGVSQSAVATTELCGKADELVKIGQEKDLPLASELADGQITSRDDERDLGKGGKTAELGQEKDLPLALGLADGQITSRDDEKGEGSRLAPSAVDNLQTAELVTHTKNKLEASSVLKTGPATEKKRKRTKSSKDHVNQSTAAATTTPREIENEIKEVSGSIGCVDASSKSCPISERETLGNPLVEVEAIQKETEMCEKSAEDVGRDNIESDNLTSHPEKHLEANNGLTTSSVIEKKKRRKKSSKDDINQSVAAATITATATTASREIVTEINGVPGNVDCVDATSESCPISRRGNLGKENEMGEKINEDVGSGKAIPSSADNIQINNLVSYPENQLEASGGLTAGPATEKKKKQRKSSKDHINQSTAATTTSRKIVNEREKVSESIDRVEATSESFPHSRGEKLADNLVEAIENENEMSDKFVDKVGSRDATLIGADKIQAVDNLQVAGLVSTPHALVHESKTMDDIGKLMDEDASCEQEVSKEKVETDADQAKSVKSTKKKSSKKAKTPAKEDTLVASGAQNVEPIRVVDGEGPDNVIRNVLDSLQQRNETEENLEKIGKKSSKSSKKKHSLNVVEAQVLDSLQQKNETEGNLDESGKKSSKRSKTKHSSNAVEAQVLSVEVNNAAQEDAHPINNPKDSDASFTPAKKDTESNASHLKKSIEVVDHSDAFVKGAVNNKKEAVKKSSNSAKVNKSKMNVNNKKEAVKKSSNSVTVDKSKMNFFKDDEKSNSAEDEFKTTSDVSTKTPSDSSSDGDSDVTSMSRKQGNNLAGGTNTFSGSLQDLLRSSKSYKKAKLTASQSQPDVFDDESPALDFVPDSQAN